MVNLIYAVFCFLYSPVISFICEGETDQFKSGKFRFGKGCYYYSKFEVTFSKALTTCTKAKGKLAVAEDPKEIYYLTSTFGNTYLGVRGEFNNQTVRWKNIYNEKLMQNPPWFRIIINDGNSPQFSHRAMQLANGAWYPISQNSHVSVGKAICVGPFPTYIPENTNNESETTSYLTTTTVPTTTTSTTTTSTTNVTPIQCYTLWLNNQTLICAHDLPNEVTHKEAFNYCKSINRTLPVPKSIKDVLELKKFVGIDKTKIGGGTPVHLGIGKYNSSAWIDLYTGEVIQFNQWSNEPDGVDNIFTDHMYVVLKSNTLNPEIPLWGLPYTWHQSFTNKSYESIGWINVGSVTKERFICILHISITAIVMMIFGVAFFFISTAFILFLTTRPNIEIRNSD